MNRESPEARIRSVILWRLKGLAAATLCSAVLLAGTVQAQAQTAPDEVEARSPSATDDRLEPINRLSYEFNQELVTHVLDPFSEFYMANVPPSMQVKVKNFFANLREPATVVNAALLGRFDDATNAGARFAVNTTYGILGFNDEAAALGFERNPVSLEQVLCEYKVPEGPYVVLPILGPATLRDAAARIATVYAYVFAMGSAYWPYRGSDIAVQYVDLSREFRRINETALDPYVVQRSTYLMNRRNTCPVTDDGGPAER